MKAVCKKLFSLMLVAILLVSAVPFQASAEETIAPVTEAPTVATEAAAVPAAAAEVEEEITATAPEAYAGVQMETDVVYVDFQLDTEGNIVETTWQVDLVKSGLGKKASTPSGSAALKVLAKAIGSSEGYEFVRWYYYKNGEKTTFTSSTVISYEGIEFAEVEVKEKFYPSLDVYAEFQTYPTNITLKPNGGTVATTKHKVELNKPYNEYGTLPVPTRSGYTFLGWYKADGTRVDEDYPIVTSLGALTAEWAAGKHTVTYKGYTDGGWEQVGFGSFDVDNNSVLKTAYNNFPTSSQIDELFDIVEGWEIDGWEYSNDNEKTWNTFTAGKTKITGTTTIRPLYKKSITLYANDSGNTKRSLTVTLGKVLPTLPHPGTRDNYAFIGWALEQIAPGECTEDDVIVTSKNLSNVSDPSRYVVDLELTALYAGWDKAVTVYLYIHTNGNTDEHTKLVKYYDVPATGFDLTTIDLGDIFPNYGKYDDKGDEKWGWYTEAQWENYCLGRQKYDTTEYADEDFLGTDDRHSFYIMLIDNGNNASSGSSNGTGYNDNKTTVDSSNPSTGDDIFVAVAIMAVSACAVLLIFMNRKRIVK